MYLQAHYEAMRTAAIRQLARGEADLDPLIDFALDTRRGITLLARPPAHITAAIGDILVEFQRIEPTQYYYPATDIHLTILSIISCYQEFNLDLIDPAAYRQAVATILQNVRPFTITFAGLTASPGGIMVQGFPQDNGLANLRDQTRLFFQQSGLQQSIDQRYSIQTAHSTVLRFRNKLLNDNQMLEIFAKYQEHFIGSFEVDTVELVYNDWYQRAQNTVLLERYSLAGV